MTVPSCPVTGLMALGFTTVTTPSGPVDEGVAVVTTFVMTPSPPVRTGGSPGLASSGGGKLVGKDGRPLVFLSLSIVWPSLVGSGIGSLVLLPPSFVFVVVVVVVVVPPLSFDAVFVLVVVVSLSASLVVVG